MLQVQEAFLCGELFQMLEHQAVLAKRGLAEPATRLGVLEKSRSCLGNRDLHNPRFFRQRVPRSARLGFDDQLLGALPVGRMQDLSEETMAALAFNVYRAEQRR